MIRIAGVRAAEHHVQPRDDRPCRDDRDECAMGRSHRGESSVSLRHRQVREPSANTGETTAEVILAGECRLTMPSKEQIRIARQQVAHDCCSPECHRG